MTALLGVTEPALFGVNVRLRKPLIATTIGGGLGGLYAGLTGVRRFGGGGAGLAAIGLYVGENPMNVINALISAAIALWPPLRSSGSSVLMMYRKKPDLF